MTFICPVKNPRVTSKFGYRTIFGKREWHQGIDLVSRDGAYVPIFASADGVVIRCGPLSSYGNIVMIRHTVDGERMDTNYAHLHVVNVRVGQQVKQGQQIGVMGTTGRSTGVHLHFEIHNGPWAPGQPNAVDPLKYISLESDGELSMSQYKELLSKINEQDAKIKSLEAQLKKKADVSSSASVADWAKGDWKWAVENGITDGTNPNGTTTRQQTVALIKRTFDKIAK